MKKIRCPKCDESIMFDETQYEPGRILVFECPACHKQFKLRLPRSLHRSLAEHSQREGISMNQYCVYLLAKNDALHAG